MNLFKNNKKDVKEFMKYEDGEIVSIEVAQKPKPKFIDPYPKEPTPQIPLSKKIKDKGKKFFTPKTLKWLGAIALCLLFSFAAYDMFKAFSQTDTGSGGQTPTVQQPNGTVVVSEPTKKPEGTTKPLETNAEPSNSSFQTNPIGKPATGTVNSGNPAVPATTVGDLIQLANQANALMLKIARDEISYLERYQNRQANLVGMQNQLKRSMQDKENLYATFSGMKSSFIQANMEPLYTATEKRLFESIVFTKQVDSILSGASGATQTAVQQYVQTDDTLRLEQQAKLIEALKANQISYTVHEADNQVVYTTTK